jgi:hypothetical protein
MLNSYLVLTQEEEKRYEKVEARDPQVADYTDNVSMRAFSFSFPPSVFSLVGFDLFL